MKRQHLLGALPVLALAAALLSACPGAVTPTPAAATPIPPTATSVSPTSTLIPPTETPVPPTETPIPPTATATPAPPTNTPEPPTATPIPTATPVPPTATPEPPTATPTPAAPQAVPKQNINLRAGPGINYPVVGAAKAGQALTVVGKNADGSWLQVCCVAEKQAWLSASLVTVEGAIAAVPVPADIPTPPPTAAAPKPVGGALSGVLIYSVANLDADKWELWEYTFANGQSRALFDWRTEVAFSRDYKQIAYYAWPPVAGGNPGIWIMNRDYTGERLVIRGGAYPSFSPDGGRLSAGDGKSVYVLNSDGGGLRRIVEGEYPAWSPTSNWIAHRACIGGACGIYLTDPDSGARQRLTEGGSDGQPAWSPDGKQIAYISKDDGNFEIYRIDVSGANKVRLTNNPASDGLPVWSPNGAWIAFRSDRGGSWAIYVMRADGSDVRKLVDAPVLPLWFFEKMGWRP